MKHQVRILPPYDGPVVLKPQQYASASDLQEPSDLQSIEPFSSTTQLTITQTGTLSRLPVELLYNVVEHLRIEEITYLSLTCRELYQDKHLRRSWASAFRGRPKWLHIDTRAPELDERLRFLMLRWLDLPNHSLCGFCFSFYMKGRPLSGWFDCGDCLKTVHFSGIQVVAGYQLPWWCIRSVLDCDARGFAQDRNLNCMRLDTDWQLQNDLRQPLVTWLAKSSVELEIVGGRLMTHACQRLLYTLDHTLITDKDAQIVQLWARRAVRYLLVCMDLNRKDVFLPLSERMDRSVSQISKLIMDEYAFKKTSELRRCSTCLTDFKCTVHKHPEGVIEIILDTWSIMEESPRPWDSVHQYSARWSYESNASNLDSIALLSTIKQPPKQSARFGPKVLRTLRSTSLWRWVKNKTRKRDVY